MSENHCCQGVSRRRRRRRRRKRGEGESLPVCVCVHARYSKCIRTDTWHSPSLAAHIVESSLPVWAILHLSLLSLFFLLFPPFIFCPRLSAFFIPPSPCCFSSPPCPSNLILLFWISPTMVQDFCCPSRRGSRLVEVSRPIWARGWMDGSHECGIQL